MFINSFVKIIFTDEIAKIVGFQDGEVAIVLLDGEEIPVFIEHLQAVPDDFVPPEIENNNKKQISGKTTPTNPPAHQLSPPPKTVEPAKQNPDNQTNLPTKPNLGKKNPLAPSHPEKDNGITLAYVATYDANGEIVHFTPYLINNSGYTLQITAEFVCPHDAYTRRFTLTTNNAQNLPNLLFGHLNYAPRYKFLCHLTHLLEGIRPNFELLQSPKVKMINRPANTLNIINLPGWLFVLCNKLPASKSAIMANETPVSTENLTNDVLQPKQKTQPDYKPKVKLHHELRIIDLHIENLVEGKIAHLKNHEKLKIQLDVFDREIAAAIQHREKTMVVIHGLGKGRLRDEILSRLRFYPQVCDFNNDYDAKYGFGATKIFFDYK
ncbi:MAG: hypothetical protein IPG29_12015 [Sphingobacteriales bacterium]|nr:hypothetical protein [Sphingobacteriales bacterium]